MSKASATWAEVVRSGTWTAFRGLPARLTEAELLAGLGRDPAGDLAPASSPPVTMPPVSSPTEPSPPPRRPALLGSRQRDLVELDGLRYWLDAANVVLAELEDPSSALAPAELVAALGPSDREGAGRHRRFGATTTEHVYAGRGLALTVAESYDEPPAFEPFVAAVQLFAAADLRTFVLELGGNDRGGPRL